MDINQARRLLSNAQACFQELNLPLVNETEKTSCDCCSNYLQFRSWKMDNGNMAEILFSVYPNDDIIELCMNFYVDIDESYVIRLLEFINGMNYHLIDAYWICQTAKGKVLYRFAQMIDEYAFDRDAFIKVVAEFIENGPRDFQFMERLVKGNENVEPLLMEWLDPVSIEDM